MAKILMVLSAADGWTRTDGTKYDSGIWAEEFVAMHERFADAGHDISLASPGGVSPTIDKKSLDPKVVGEELAAHCARYLQQVSDELSKPIVLSNIDLSDYDAVVIPGGHGPAEDLYKDTDMGRILIEANRDRKIIAAVCHGPAALLSAVDTDGAWPFAGRKVTGLSDAEEIAFGTAKNAPWLLESELRRLGGKYEHGENWKPFVVQDGNLLSGQNPASSAMLADAVLQAI